MVLSDPSDAMRTIPITAPTLKKGLLQTLAPRGKKVIWQDRNAEAIFDPEAFRIGLRLGLIVAEIPLTTDQTNRANIVITLSVGSSPKDATLLATTPQQAIGHSVLSARWGHLTQDVLWNALLKFGEHVINEEMGQDKMKLGGLYTTDEMLHLIPIPYYTLAEIAKFKR